jgi:hypothetical protein
MAGIRTLGLSACVLKYFSKRPETMPPIVPLTMSGCPGCHRATKPRPENERVKPPMCSTARGKRQR